MSVFARQYPAKLQAVVKHAERFCMLLDEGWAVDRDEARVWLVGRQEEIDLVVACFVEDWEKGRVDEDSAARSVGAYLRALHLSGRGVLEAGDAFACCSDGGAITLAPIDLAAMTRFVPLAEVRRVETSLASDTIAMSEPAALVAEWLAKTGRK